MQPVTAIHLDPGSQTIADRRAAGVALRKAVPRNAQGDWAPDPDRRDPVAILEAQNRTRIPELVPVRYARMQPTPFTFLRGAAAIMAADLATTAVTGLRVQSCGDCHLANFGAYASPEGLPVFDINDFDETLPAPFEWDLKRLATSLILAGKDRVMTDRASHELAERSAQAYGRAMNQLAGQAPLVAWNSRIDLSAAIADITKTRIRLAETKRLDTVLRSNKSGFGLITQDGSDWRIRDKPPLVHHRLVSQAFPTRAWLEGYAATLPPERRVLLDR
jgi:hypothetical protein